MDIDHKTVCPLCGLAITVLGVGDVTGACIRAYGAGDMDIHARYGADDRTLCTDKEHNTYWTKTQHTQHILDDVHETVCAVGPPCGLAIAVLGVAECAGLLSLVIARSWGGGSAPCAPVGGWSLWWRFFW